MKQISGKMIVTTASGQYISLRGEKMRKVFIAIILFFFWFSLPAMAANVTVSSEGKAEFVGLNAYYLILSIDADAGGTASYTFSTDLFNEQRPGTIYMIHITPDATTPPTTLYDVYLYDDASATKQDLFGDEGLNLVNTANIYLNLVNPTTLTDYFLPLNTPPTLSFSGLGDGTGGPTAQATAYVLILTESR